MIYLIGECWFKDNKPFTWTMGATKKLDILECLAAAQIKCIHTSVPCDLNSYKDSRSLGNIKFTSMSRFAFDFLELTDIIDFVEVVLKKTKSLKLETNVYLDASQSSIIHDALKGVVPNGALFKLIW